MLSAWTAVGRCAGRTSGSIAVATAAGVALHVPLHGGESESDGEPSCECDLPGVAAFFAGLPAQHAMVQPPPDIACGDVEQHPHPSPAPDKAGAFGTCAAGDAATYQATLRQSARMENARKRIRRTDYTDGRGSRPHHYYRGTKRALRDMAPT